MFGLIPYGRKNTLVGRSGDLWNVDRVFDNFFRDPFFSTPAVAGGQIRTDIRETDKEYIFEAELPGVRKEDIFLEIKDDVLTFGVDQNQETEEDRDGYLCRERRCGSVRRSFRVDKVAEADVKASYTDGVLRIVLPKTEVVDTTRRIEIQ
jgi:HSP20 family protein